MKYALVLFLLIAFLNSSAQQVIPLYDKVPNSKRYTGPEIKREGKNEITRVHKVSLPTLTIYRPEGGGTQTPAVIICPGGGYYILAIDHEGYDVAKALAGAGVTGIVLKYRLPEDSIVVDPKIAPLQDAQRAIQLVRQNARDWGIDPDKIGIMGFSAGGHLAATASTLFDEAKIDNSDNISLRPDFSVLVYPVISFHDSITHQGSKDRLLGKNATQNLADHFSPELQVTDKTPPAFLVHASDDKAVPPQNSIRYYEALHRVGGPAELHIYQAGGHGFGLHNKTTKEKWLDRLLNWMTASGILTD